jgi:hypothetical protein
MPTEVISPISRKGGKVGSIDRAESPGARSMPGRGDQAEPPSQQRPVRATVDLGEQGEPASLTVTGPEDD